MSIELKYADVEIPVTITDAVSYNITPTTVSYTTKTATKTEVVSLKQTALEYVKVIN